MNIDHLPISAFALESCTAPAAAAGEVHTLTLQLALAIGVGEPLAGTVSVPLTGMIAVASPSTQRVSILPADPSALTITFD